MCVGYRGFQELEKFKEEKNYSSQNVLGRAKEVWDLFLDLRMQAGVYWEGKEYQTKAWQGRQDQRWEWPRHIGRHSKPIWLSAMANVRQ